MTTTTMRIGQARKGLCGLSDTWTTTFGNSNISSNGQATTGPNEDARNVSGLQAIDRFHELYPDKPGPLPEDPE